MNLSDTWWQVSEKCSVSVQNWHPHVSLWNIISYKCQTCTRFHAHHVYLAICCCIRIFLFVLEWKSVAWPTLSDNKEEQPTNQFLSTFSLIRFCCSGSLFICSPWWKLTLHFPFFVISIVNITFSWQLDRNTALWKSNIKLCFPRKCVALLSMQFVW